MSLQGPSLQILKQFLDLFKVSQVPSSLMKDPLQGCQMTMARLPDVAGILNFVVVSANWMVTEFSAEALSK